MPLPAIIAAAARILGPMLAEGAGSALGGAGARGAASAGSYLGMSSRGRASAAAFDVVSRRGPPTAGGGGPGGGGGDWWAPLKRGLANAAESIGGGGGPPGGGGGGDDGGHKGRQIDLSGLINSPREALHAFAKTVENGRRIIENDFAGLARANLPEPVARLVTAFDEAAKSIVARTDYLKRFNGELAFASANREVQKLQADMREANAVGPAYKKVTDQYTRLETGFQDLTNPVKEGLATYLAAILEKLNQMIDASALPEIAKTVGLIYGILGDLISGDLDDLMERIEKIPDNILEGWARRFGFATKKKKDIDMLGDLLKQSEQQIPFLPGNVPLPNPGQRMLPNIMDGFGR